MITSPSLASDDTQRAVRAEGDAATTLEAIDPSRDLARSALSHGGRGRIDSARDRRPGRTVAIHCPTLPESAVYEFLRGARAIGLDYVEALLAAVDLEVRRSEQAAPSAR